MNDMQDPIQFRLRSALRCGLCLAAAGIFANDARAMGRAPEPAPAPVREGAPEAGAQRDAAVAANAREGERMNMVDRQITARGIRDERVLAAMRAVPRHLFVPPELEGSAYEDRPLPIGFGQTISQPYIVAFMCAMIEAKEDFRILEIGAGSGYHAAVLGAIAKEVYTVEIVPELAQRARERLERAGITNVRVKQGDGFHGWEEHAPFDAIVVTAASPLIPPPLIAQLKEGGRMIIPVGSPFRTQQLVLVEKQADGRVSTNNVLPVQFVPFTRAPGAGEGNE